MWNHSLIDRHILVKAIQALSGFHDNVLKLPHAINFIESRILSGETLCVVSQVKVSPNLEKPGLSNDRAHTFLVYKVSVLQ